MPSNVCSMFFLPTYFVIFSTKKKLGIFRNFLGVACVNLNNLAKILFAKIHQKLDKLNIGVGVDINHSFGNITSSEIFR
jgi:hypothetical protein